VWHTTNVASNEADPAGVTKNEWQLDSLTDFQIKCINAQVNFISEAKTKLTNSAVRFFAVHFRNNNQVENPWYDGDIYQAPYYSHDNQGNTVLVVTPYENSAGYCKLTSAQTIIDAVSTTL